MDNVLEQNGDSRFVLDEIENAVDSLSTAAKFSSVRPIKWKWVVIAVHHALYSFCVAVLGMKNPAAVIEPRRKDDELTEQEWENVIRWVKREDIELTRREKRYLKTKIISFGIALKRVQDGECWMTQYVHTKPVRLSALEAENLTWLNDEARNALLHFVPGALILEVSELRQACLDAIRVIEFLVCHSGTLRDYKDYRWKLEVAGAIESLRASLNQD